MTKTQFFTRALAALTVVGALVVTAPTGVPGAPQAADAVVGDCTPGSDWGTPRQDFAARVVDLVNQHRASKGLSQLTVSTTLTNASIWKSRHMARYLYMAHNDPAPPVARTTSERLAACGYPSTTTGWGENIAYGYTTPEAVMQGWLNSPGHRANIENRELPLDRRRRSVEHHRPDLLGAGVRHPGRLDAPATPAASDDLQVLQRPGRRRRRQDRLPGRPRLHELDRQRRVQRTRTTATAPADLQMLQRPGRRRRRQDRLPGRPRLHELDRQRRVQRTRTTATAPADLQVLQRPGRRRRRQDRLPGRPRLHELDRQRRVQRTGTAARAAAAATVIARTTEPLKILP